MDGELDRETLIGLLERLGGTDDADVLAAAREAHGAVAGAGVAWTDLLVAADTEPDDDEDSDDGEPEDTEPEDTDQDDEEEPAAIEEAPAAVSKGNAESLRLIGKLLPLAGDDSNLVEELNGYKKDIAAGEFDSRDQRYLNDLYARLKK